MPIETNSGLVIFGAIVYGTGMGTWFGVMFIEWRDQRTRRAALRVLGSPLWGVWLVCWGVGCVRALVSDVLSGGKGED
jgi:hypothetical protein